MIYEGYGPHGIAVMVETATDNTNRTVANVRMHFSRCGGTLGNSGSVAFLFEHKCVFKFHVSAGTDFEELELSMIDLGVDEFAPEDETTVTVEAPYESFGAIQKWLDDQNYEIVSGESIRIATDTKELHGEEREAVEKLIERWRRTTSGERLYRHEGRGGRGVVFRFAHKDDPGISRCRDFFVRRRTVVGGFVRLSAGASAVASRRFVTSLSGRSPRPDGCRPRAADRANGRAVR